MGRGNQPWPVAPALGPPRTRSGDLPNPESYPSRGRWFTQEGIVMSLAGAVDPIIH